jgi:hypothetical protein
MSEPSAVERVIDAYCAAWNEPDRARRREMLSAVWRAEATYTDPTAHVAGVDQLVAHIEKVLARRPGARVVRTSAVDAHHGFVRFAWRVVQTDGTLLPEGIDFAEVDNDGAIRGVVGFFGPLAAR